MSNIGHDIHKAAALLKEGRLVAFPTETVYGLGGNALSDDAVADIYEAKGRPDFNPLIVHVRSLEEANLYIEWGEQALALARHFWPGPLTMVLPRKPDCKLSLLVSAGLDTVAIRMPAHPLAQALLHEAQLPVAAPSANRSGRISPTEASHVHEELGDRIAMILDGGPCSVGIESTVVDMTGPVPVILRPGSVTEEQLSEIICHPALVAGSPIKWMEMPQQVRHDRIKSPGMLASHYAPSHPMRLHAVDVKSDEALLAFGAPVPMGTLMVENLSPHGDLREAAANLFRMLRRLDATQARTIAVMPIPEEGLGIAINDRLRRAAATNKE